MESKTDIVEYDSFLRDVVKDRDFVVFRPWRTGTVENHVVWHHRVIHAAAERFRRDPAEVARDLESVLLERRRHIRTQYLRRSGALLSLSYLKGKRAVARRILFPLARRRYVGRERVVRPKPVARTQGMRISAPAPAASIVVVSYNRLPYLRTTLNSLRATTAREDYELIVVDHGSTDGPAEALRDIADWGIVDKLILCRENRGTSAGFNLGFAFANPLTRYLIKLDSDIDILTAGWLTRFERFFDRVPDVGVLALTLVNHLGHALARTQRVGGERVASWDAWVAGGGCMTIPRALFGRLGYFREDPVVKYAADDADYSVRMAILRLRSFYLRGTRGYHCDDLDAQYDELKDDKERQCIAARDQLIANRNEYLVGTRGLYVSYPAYENCVFPEGERILEWDESAQRSFRPAEPETHHLTS
jgi:glycosyltransferase involved in cell wall biosynthesis